MWSSFGPHLGSHVGKTLSVASNILRRQNLCKFPYPLALIIFLFLIPLWSQSLKCKNYTVNVIWVQKWQCFLLHALFWFIPFLSILIFILDTEFPDFSILKLYFGDSRDGSSVKNAFLWSEDPTTVLISRFLYFKAIFWDLRDGSSVKSAFFSSEEHSLMSDRIPSISNFSSRRSDTYFWPESTPV